MRLCPLFIEIPEGSRRLKYHKIIKTCTGFLAWLVLAQNTKWEAWQKYRGLGVFY
jgi:hypothetical protein